MGRGIMVTTVWFIPKALLLWVVIEIFSILIRVGKRKKISMVREIFVNLFAVYIICLVGITIFPVAIVWNPKKLPEELKPTINLIPFTDIFTSIKSMGLHNALKHYVGNLFLLSPLGFIIPMLHNNKFSSLKSNLLLGFVVSLSIELLQYIQALLTPIPSAKLSRSTDINDLIFNTIGVLIGYTVYKIVHMYAIKCGMRCRILHVNKKQREG